MNNYKKGKRFGGDRDGKKFGGGGRSFGGDRGGRGGFGGGWRGGDRPEMHKAVCTDCGNNCEVPFRPTGDKPIFCNDCFKGKRDDNSRGSRDGGKRDRGFGGRDSKPRFDNKPSYQGGAVKDIPNYKAQFEILNTKLDAVLKTLTLVTAKKSEDMVILKSKKVEKSERKDKVPKRKVDKVSLKKVVKKTTDKKVVTNKKNNLYERIYNKHRKRDISK